MEGSRKKGMTKSNDGVYSVVNPNLKIRRSTENLLHSGCRFLDFSNCRFLEEIQKLQEKILLEGNIRSSITSL